MANTYTLISSVTVGSGGASSIDFTSIPATYTDLVLKISGRFNYASGLNSNIGIKYNGSSSNLSRRTVYGTGSAAGSNSGNDGFIGDANAAQSTSSTFGNCEVYIPNYTGSTYKSYSSDTVYENNGTTAWSYEVAGLWSNTAAITSISLYDIFNSSNWIQYSTAYLYGIKNS